MQPSARQTIGFVAAVAVVSSVLVATSAVALRQRQQDNAILDLRRKVLMVAGLTAPGTSPSPLEVTQLFESNIRAEVVTLATGAVSFWLPSMTGPSRLLKNANS